MRYVHPVTPHEKFVASGTYRYYKDGTPSGLVEHWTIHEQPDGAWFMRVDRDGRDFDGLTELIETYRSPEGHIERFDLTAFGDARSVIRRAKATYTLEGNVLYAGRTLNDGERLQDTIELPDCYAVQPGGYVFFGIALPYVIAHAPCYLLSRTSAVEPLNESYMPGLVQPTVTYYGEDTLRISGQDRAARRYTSAESVMVPGEPKRTVQWHNYWIDEHDIFLKHEGPGMVVELERYAHRPVPKT